MASKTDRPAQTVDEAMTEGRIEEGDSTTLSGVKIILKNPGIDQVLKYKWELVKKQASTFEPEEENEGRAAQLESRTHSFFE